MITLGHLISMLKLVSGAFKPNHVKYYLWSSLCYQMIYCHVGVNL